MALPDALLRRALGGVALDEPAQALYGERADFAAWAAGVLESVVAAQQRRSEALRRWDAGTAPDWFQVPDALGYAAYADRFAGSQRGVAEHLALLKSNDPVIVMFAVFASRISLRVNGRRDVEKTLDSEPFVHPLLEKFDQLSPSGREMAASTLGRWAWEHKGEPSALRDVVEQRLA